MTDLAHGIWEIPNDAKDYTEHVHTVPNLSVAAYLQIHDVKWTTMHSPWSSRSWNEVGVRETGSAPVKRSVEVHKKCDKKLGDVLIVFRVENPDEPRSKHKRRQLCTVNVNTLKPVEAPAEMDGEDVVAFTLYFQRSNALLVAEQLAEVLSKDSAAEIDASSLKDKFIKELGGYNDKPPRKRSAPEAGNTKRLEKTMSVELLATMP